jgi:hypothetical protein
LKPIEFNNGVEYDLEMLQETVILTVLKITPFILIKTENMVILLTL